MDIAKNIEDSEFSSIFEVLKKRPNKFILHDVFLADEFYEHIEKYEINRQESNYISELIKTDSGNIINRRVCHKLKSSTQLGELWVSFLEFEVGTDESTISEVCFHYDDPKNETIIFEIVDNLTSLQEEFDDSKISKIKCLTQSASTLEISNVILNPVTIEGFYNKSIEKKIKSCVKKINKNKKGISILCGERGLGKTEAVKFICQEISRESIFIPNNLVDHSINNAEFKNTISSGKYMLVIDDCEFLYTFGKNNFFTSNILQMIDGFLSDQLNLHILLIFNTDVEDVDYNLVNSNNLINLIEFEPLDTKVANALFEDLELKQSVKEPIRLIDVLKNTDFSGNKKIGLE